MADPQERAGDGVPDDPAAAPLLLPGQLLARLEGPQQARIPVATALLHAFTLGGPLADRFVASEGTRGPRRR